MDNDVAMTSRTGARIIRFDPISGELATDMVGMSVSEAREVVDRANAAFPEWAVIGPTDRRMILLRVADALEAGAEELRDIMMRETGAAAPWVAFNCKLSANMVREAAALTTQINGEVLPSDKRDNLVMVLRQPVGVILSIAPWNAPIILAVRAIVTALACGNVVVLKASEVCPRTHASIVDIFIRAGVPKGVVSLVAHAAEDAPKIVEALIAHPAVKRVNFTGSTRVGRIVGALAGQHLKPALLELGGKAPLVILDDANLEEAVAAAAFGAFMHQGQICMSTERIVVDEAIAEEFVGRLAQKAKTLRAGNPRQGDYPLGSVVDPSAAGRVQQLIVDAIENGAIVAAGGPASGTILPATVLDHVKPSMRIYVEESFGPVVTIVRVSGVDEAIRVANDTEYGLAASVYGRDVGRAFQVARKIDAGIVHVNGPTVQDEAHIPFGGVKASGYGRFNGKPGIDHFTELKTVTIEQGHQHYPI